MMRKFLCAVLLAVAPTVSAWAAAAPLKVLVFSKTADYRHASIPAAIAAFEELGALHGWDVDATEDASQFNDDNLKRYDVVVWLSTSGNVLDARQKAAYERFQQSHKGTVAIHEAGTDTEREGWPWYRKMASVLFTEHPIIQKATIVLQDQTHPATFALPLRWEHVDEWYNFASDPRLDPDVHVLAYVDEETYDAGEFAMGRTLRLIPLPGTRTTTAGATFTLLLDIPTKTIDRIATSADCLLAQLSGPEAESPTIL